MTNDFHLADGVLTVVPGTQYIRSGQFSQRADIRIVIIPEGTGFMEDECFAECPLLEEVILPEGMINIGPAAFADCGSLRSINIPSSVRTVDSGAFIFCESLKEIILPDGLEAVEEYAFQNTGLVAVSVPESVNAIGDCAFFSCENLRHADVNGRDTVLGKDCLGSNYRLIEGYIAPGYPAETDTAEELLYTLLWCSCPARHGQEISGHAAAYIQSNQALIMERILKADNIPAMTGLAGLGLLSAATISDALRQTLASGQTELSALLLKAKNTVESSDGEFEL